MKTNVKQFKQLIRRYETITLDEIKKYGPFPGILTGFGDITTCTLCDVSIKAGDWLPQCHKCLHKIHEDKDVIYSCSKDNTFNDIEDASTPEELLEAYRARAEFLRKVLKKLGYKQPKK